MAGKKNPLGSTGLAVASNVKRLREAQNLTYAELSRRLASTHGRNVPVLGLRKIETLERRVDSDDLVALAAVLSVSPMDLLNASLSDDAFMSRSEVRRMIQEALQGS